MPPRRVAYVVSLFPALSETFIAGELAELHRRGIDVRILSLWRPEPSPVRDIVGGAGLLERTTYDTSAFTRVLDRFQPDLVHAHYATAPAATARSIAAARRVPFTFTAHGYDVYRRPPDDFGARAAAAASVITVSQANRRHLTRILGVAARRIHVIPCGVDTDWFTPGRPDSSPPLVVCVARLHEVKRLDLLIRACALVRDRGTAFRCAIVGEGQDRGRLEALRADLALEHHVDMPGAAGQHAVRDWWRRASVAVLSSRSEGMPVSLMEAAACGVPAVAPAVGGIPELISGEQTGFVTRAGDARHLARALHTLLVDESLRRRMGRAARRRACQRFSRARQVDRLLGVWDAALS